MATPSGDLVRQMAAGDRDAFARFYDRMAPMLYSLVLRIVRDEPDARDVLQEVFWEAWRSAGAYDPSRGSPEAWMVTRARARAIDRLRARRRRGQTFVAPLEEAAATGPSEPAGDPAEQAEARGVVQGALDRLPASQREVLELAYYGGFTQSEIAARLGQPLGTVKTRMRLALERLRETVGATA